jgi:hypothetical protein
LRYLALLMVTVIALTGFCLMQSSSQADDQKVIYEVLTEEAYPGQVLTDAEFQEWLDNGWLVPEDPNKAPQQGDDCHLVTKPCGPNCHYVDCVEGAGAVDCWCDQGVLPPNQ